MFGIMLPFYVRLTVREMRKKYHDVFGEPTRTTNRDFLVKLIGWRIWSLAEGDLSERDRRRSAEFARTTFSVTIGHG